MKQRCPALKILCIKQQNFLDQKSSTYVDITPTKCLSRSANTFYPSVTKSYFQKEKKLGPKGLFGDSARVASFQGVYANFYSNEIQNMPK